MEKLSEVKIRPHEGYSMKSERVKGIEIGETTDEEKNPVKGRDGM